VCVCVCVYNILGSKGKQINRLQQKAAFERHLARQKVKKRQTGKTTFSKFFEVLILLQATQTDN